jgi:ribosomal protein S16
MRKQLAIAAFISMSIYACKHEVLNPGAVTPPATDTTTIPNPGSGNGSGAGSTAMCFENDILPIFKSSCAKSGCHDAASKQEEYVFDSYEDIMKKGIKAGDAQESKVYKIITEDKEDERMPKAPNPRLTATQIDLIKKWINEGAKNTTNCASTCNDSIFTYAQAIRPLLDANCVGCHNGGSAAPANLNYTTHAGIKAVALSGRLVGAISHLQGFSPMPKGSPKLSDCKISQVTKWVQAGAPNN